ncbi:MAG: Rpn family recombination-promoting nuclease/putative transposase [Selenomonas sp.]|uniref:Rpn family recombination-promoting nuclease/putative transposase n=1 Tax=Selenomonas sp. TaxID=2053611 RepID=UPI002600A61B|nr:Rpn family recombination-promoting nuclease/putative transposase [Selenomonas sp.]MCR5439750.1 Rpn family recombination-promoting nuclease/putative transposase [Selenomonas sp.]
MTTGQNTDLFADLSERNYNPMNDVLFKFIFGKEERKQITIDFLNAVLQHDLQHPIQDITFTQTEMSPENEADKLTRLDVTCVLDTAEQVDVEVQVVNHKDMARRTLYYWAQLYLMSLPAGKHYRDLKPSITVNILKFKLLPQATPYSMWSIYNPETGDRLNKDLTLHFLEIPKYAKKPIAEMTKMERWLAYFANQLNDKEKEELSMTDAAIQSAMKAARIFLNNTEERRRYINREMSIMDYNSDHENARAEGLAEGRAEGERNMEITIVKRMLLKHKPLNEIIDVVAWPKEKILTFAKENNLSIYE